MNKTKTIKAFSLVEAMIILVLISVAIMAIIPLLNAQKIYAPKWKELKNDAGTVLALAYGRKASDRVGLNNVNPYEDETYTKFALPNLSIQNTSNPVGIFMGNNYIDNQYTSLYKQAEQIQLGMNTCSTTAPSSAANRIIINGATPTAAANLYNCASTLINIGNKILADPDEFAISTNRITSLDPTDGTDPSNKSIIYIDTNGGHNKFRINIPIEKNTTTLYTAMNYNGAGTLTFTDTIFDIGTDLYISPPGAPTITITDADPPGGNQITCDKNGSGECIGGGKIKQTGSLWTAETYSTTNGIPGHINIPSDLRLKNIISEYTKGIDEISKIDTYTYSYKNNPKKDYVGIIAQKLIGIFDEALQKDGQGYYSYDRMPLLLGMTNSAKEIDDKQKAITKKNKELNKEAEKLIRMYK